MIPRFLLFLVILVSVVLSAGIPACSKKNNSETSLSVSAFDSIPIAYPLPVPIREASGIADSRINPGYLWVEEDSDNPPQLYLLDHAGKTSKKIYIMGASNRDWEDIALASGPDAAKNYLYIAEIGDNNAVHAQSAFYRFEEPASTTDTVRQFDSITFTYTDGPRDAEAFLVDDASKDIYIITKRETASRIYKISWPYSTTVSNTAVLVATLPYSGVVSAAQNAAGIMLKTYTALFYYSKNSGESIAQALSKPYTKVAYQVEPQGEAITFAQDNTGFYTLSELGFSTAQVLYFYKKK